MAPFRPFWATLERVQGTKKSPKSKKNIVFLGYFCMFCNFWCPNLIFGPTKTYICPLSAIFFTLLWSGLVSVTSPFPFPLRTRTIVQSLWGRRGHKVLSHKSPISLDCHSVLCLDVFDHPRFRRFILAELLCF